MLEHYSHIRMEAKRDAVTALVLPKRLRSSVAEKRPGYVTNHDTKTIPEDELNPEVAEKIGGPG